MSKTGASQVMLVSKNPPANADFLRSLGWKDPLEEKDFMGRGVWLATWGCKELDTTKGT